MICEAREERGWTQTQLASALDTSQSAVNRIERGGQNLSLKMIGRIAEALDRTLLTIGPAGPINLRVVGDQRLSKILLFGTLSHDHRSFRLPAGGCHLGIRTVQPHLIAVHPFGIDVATTYGIYEIASTGLDVAACPIVLI